MEERDPLLSQAYSEAEHPEPPPALDVAILAAARRAVAPAPRRRSRWFAWAVPLATTAVLVLGVTLLFRMQREAPETLREAMPAPSLAQSESAPTPPSNSRTESEAKPALAEKATSAADSAASLGADRRAAPPTLARPAPGPAPAPIAIPPEHPGQAATSEAATGALAGAAPEPRPFPAQTAPAPQPEQARKASPTPPAASFAREDAAGMDRSVAPNTAVPPTRETAPAFNQGMSKLKAETPALEGPEHWVEKIRRLLREGHAEEARKTLEELRKRYPGYVLPEDLKAMR